MESEVQWTLSRREFFLASCGLLISRAGWAAPSVQPVLAWPLTRSSFANATNDARPGLRVIASVGRLLWIGPAKDAQLPRLDGYSVWFEQDFRPPMTLPGQFTLSAWLALEAYPVSTASVIEWGISSSKVRLTVDRLGYASVSLGSGSLGTRSKLPLERDRWVHLSATLSLQGRLSLYIDGNEAGSETFDSGLRVVPPLDHLYLGRSSNPEVVEKVFLTGVLNGFLREVRVYDTCLSAADVFSLAREFHSQSPAMELNRAWFADDVQRPRYHAMPTRAWTNEPHGLVHWRGEYHVFYQKNANGPYWGHIHWGHLTSPDLLHWAEQRIALTPETGPDAEGCWSGSALVENKKLHVFYTGGDGKRASICMASSDGDVFTKHPGNPIIASPPPIMGVKEFRDPFIWKEGAEYRMVIGSGIEGVGGTALLYGSRDLISWEFLKPLLTGRKETSGVFWEMPVFIRVGLFHVLIVCEVPGRASYWVGRWENDQFHVLSTEPQRLDLLNHFLSPTPHVTADGRAIVMGILPDSRDAVAAWQAGWVHVYGLPRELTLDLEGRLEQRPLRELRAGFVTLLKESNPLDLGSAWSISNARGTSARLRVEFSQGNSDAVIVALRRSPDGREQTLIRYEWRSETLILDRTVSSLNPGVLRNVEQASYVPREKTRIKFDIYMDQSALEVFLDDRVCFGARIYPLLPESIGIAFCSEGGSAVLQSMEMQHNPMTKTEADNSRLRC